MKKKLCVLLCIITTLLCGCRTSRSDLRFGAANIGGMYYSFANTFATLSNENTDSYTIEVRSTAGSAANLRLLSDNYLELGIAQADILEESYKNNQNLRAISGLYTEACQLVVREQSDIHSLADLAGHSISVGDAESGTEKNANQILAFAGLTPSIVDIQNLDYTASAKALKNGDIDAFFCTAGVSTTVINELAYKCDIRLISLDDTCVDRMLASSDAYSKYIIPANTYPGQTEDVTTIGVKAVLVTTDAVSAETIHQITQLLFNEASTLQYAISLDLQVDEENALQNIPVPFHNGALAYYEEQGIALKPSE